LKVLYVEMNFHFLVCIDDVGLCIVMLKSVA